MRQRQREASEGSGDRGRGASGDGASWAAARVAGWLGRLAPGPPGLASARFSLFFGIRQGENKI